MYLLDFQHFLLYFIFWYNIKLFVYFSKIVLTESNEPSMTKPILWTAKIKSNKKTTNISAQRILEKRLEIPKRESKNRDSLGNSWQIFVFRYLHGHPWNTSNVSICGIYRLSNWMAHRQSAGVDNGFHGYNFRWVN